MKYSGKLLNLVKICIVAVLSINLTGCWDMVEMEEQDYVAVIGIDKGENNMLEVTLEIINPQGGGFSNIIGSSPTEPASETITVTLPDILSIRDTATASVTKRITYTHTMTLVVGEELARSGKLLSALEGALRDRQVRRNMFTIVSKEKASEFIRNNAPKLETRPHKFYEYMSERWQEEAFVPVSNLNKFIQTTEGGSELFLNLYGTAEKTESKKHGEDDNYLPGQINMEGGNPTQLMGSAVFKDGKMIGTLTGEETRYASLLRLDEQLKFIFVNIPDPLGSDYQISTRIFKRKVKFNIDIDEDPPKIDIKIPLSVYIIGIPSGVNYVDNIEKQKLLEKSIEEIMSEKAEQLIKRSQQEFGGEMFSWSTAVRRKFNTWDEYKKYNWMEKYPKADVNVKFDVVIEGFSKQMEPSKLHKQGD